MIGLNINNLSKGSRDERTGEIYLTTGIELAAYSLLIALLLLLNRE